MGDAGRQMFQAISDKNMKVINIVLGNKPYPKEMWLHVNNSQQNSLMMAVQLAPEQDAATFTAVILSVQEPRTPLDAVNKFGQTALMMAAKKGYADVVKLLLEAGANYELRNQVCR
jgi:ankyrin repeat protein